MKTLDQKKLIDELETIYQFAKQYLEIKERPVVTLVYSQDNADKVYAMTGHYDPANKTITLYCQDRHPKDIIRSFCHELIHHRQNEQGMLMHGEQTDTSDPAYILHNKYLRQMEEEAFLEGNMMLRHFTDTLKEKNMLYENKQQRLAELVSKKLEGGETPEELVKKLVAKGVPEEKARMAVGIANTKPKDEEIEPHEEAIAKAIADAKGEVKQRTEKGESKKETPAPMGESKKLKLPKDERIHADDRQKLDEMIYSELLNKFGINKK
jgi:hypothetical protein